MKIMKIKLFILAIKVINVGYINISSSTGIFGGQGGFYTFDSLKDGLLIMKFAE